MLSMITSAMFYEKDETSLTGLQMGPFTLSVQQVLAVGVHLFILLFT